MNNYGSFNEAAIIDFENTCDACSRAQAFFKVFAKSGKGGFQLCLHDFRIHESALVAQGYHVEDESHKLNTKPSVSANAE